MILMYHKVDIIAPTIWWMTPNDLQQQLACLSDKAFVYLDDYRSAEHEVVLTFDDAYENVFRHALPILVRCRVPFEVFVIGSQIGGWNEFDPDEPRTRHMDVEQLRQVTQCGGRLQWHTRSHAHLPDLSQQAIEEELTVPQELKRQFGSPHFTWLSYPGGSLDDRSLGVARRHFAGAVSVFQGNPRDKWQLNRVTVDRDTTFLSHDRRDGCA